MAVAVVLASIVGVARVGSSVASALVGAGPSDHRSASVHVVQPGETLWSIARQLQPTGDVRPLVRKLLASVGSPDLVVGQRVTLPGG
jgi:LysM repeat protein